MNKFNCVALIGLFLFLVGCGEHNETDSIHFATSAEYPPFEYQEHGEIKGFDIELANLLAEKLGKKAVFDNMQFSSVLPALTSGQADAAIATLTITEERKQNFDFTIPYYFQGMAAVFKKEVPVSSKAQLAGKKIACQLGSTMEIWLKQNALGEVITAMDNNNQAIEALKAGYFDVVIMDKAQAAIFSQKNPGLAYATIAQAKDGFGIAFKKHSLLTAKINRALNTLKANGELEKLQKKWLEDSTWKK